LEAKEGDKASKGPRRNQQMVALSVYCSCLSAWDKKKEADLLRLKSHSPVEEIIQHPLHHHMSFLLDGGMTDDSYWEASCSLYITSLLFIAGCYLFQSAEYN
jgi:hypothetical protein